MKLLYKLSEIVFICILLFIASSCSKPSDNSNPFPPLTTVTDIDGNVYHTIKIETQVWMVENLKTTKDNNGSSIPLVTYDSVSKETLTPAYCWYQNNIGFKDTYGALYNRYVVHTGILAPAGWHVSSDNERLTLFAYLSGPFQAGGPLKEKDTLRRASPNAGATDANGFKALPDGYRTANLFSGSATYNGIRKSCCFWSTSEYSATEVGDLEIYHDKSTASLYSMYKNWGISVHCIKD
ncbi:MAG: fibrobacter succinogenes major paralogous domain-containing protein [Bacteroidetes bacterium]|nr:fibrobacter succinogenes major paralogous domain-containing protein [Bacteroidota bacterium]